MKKVFLLTFIVSLSFPLISSSTSVKKTMNSVLRGFTGLIPYMSDPMKFKDPSHKEVIHTHLTTMKNAFDNARHNKTLKLPGFSPSYKEIKTHMGETLDAFEAGHWDFTRVRIRATGELCMSCHTQLGGQNRSALLHTLSRDHFSSNFNYAEFLFLTRDYRKAERYYLKEIEASLEKKKEILKISPKVFVANKVDESLEKLLVIHTKIKFSPDKAISRIENFKDDKLIGKQSRKKIISWLKDLNELKRDGKNLAGKKSIDYLIGKHLSTIESDGYPLNGELDVPLLVSSGVMYRRLLKVGSSSEVPKLLYWISKTEGYLNHSHLFSLSDLYLKRCISDYSHSSWAKKCLDLYEDRLVNGYTGSAGTSIPKSEKDELERLRKLLGPKSRP